jgi:choline dehydrogenase
METVDVIIVGAGAAGCVVAGYLATHTDWRIALVEAGTAIPRPARRPAQFLQSFSSPMNWGESSTPQDTLGGRRIALPRGRALGGSTAINAMIYLPPTKRESIALTQAGGWDPDELNRAHARLLDLRPGGGGLRLQTPATLSPAVEALLDTARAHFGTHATLAPFVRFNNHGRRWTAYDAFVRPLRTDRNRRKQLGIIHRAIADCVVVDRQRAVGVQLRDGPMLAARCGVILAAGSVGSPTLLQRSGITSPPWCAGNGIRLQHPIEGVGERLQDHLLMPIIASMPPSHAFPATFDAIDQQRWNRDGSGPLASNLAEAGGLLHDVGLQFHFTPTHYLRYPHPDAPPAATIGVNVTNPRARGRIMWQRSADGIEPSIDPGYLSDPADRALLREGMRHARAILERLPPPLESRELLPGARRDDDRSMDAAIDRHALTLYHTTSSCAMGPVVDGSGRVVGMEGLTIVDGSILPEVPTVNPQATIMSVALRLAERFIGAVVDRGG